jgi:glycosyltransferase involved in cell wall biosynthesis
MLIGPVVKISHDVLPKNENIHYLGAKGYDDLPLYLSGWDVALVPFVLNESTRFISPTKTPEYLAGGKPVVSSAIKDVVNPYAKNKLVSIGVDADDFVAAIDALLENPVDETWLAKVDAFLADNCWDNTFSAMKGIMVNAMENRTAQVSLASE